MVIQNSYEEPPKTYEVKIGMILPKENVYLKPTVGFGTSAGALTIAIERIKREHLLDGANFK